MGYNGPSPQEIHKNQVLIKDGTKYENKWFNIELKFDGNWLIVSNGKIEMVLLPGEYRTAEEVYPRPKIHHTAYKPYDVMTIDGKIEYYSNILEESYNSVPRPSNGETILK